MGDIFGIIHITRLHLIIIRRIYLNLKQIRLVCGDNFMGLARPVAFQQGHNTKLLDFLAGLIINL